MRAGNLDCLSVAATLRAAGGTDHLALEQGASVEVVWGEKGRGTGDEECEGKEGRGTGDEECEGKAGG